MIGVVNTAKELAYENAKSLVATASHSYWSKLLSIMLQRSLDNSDIHYTEPTWRDQLLQVPKA
eukprot:11144825-Karenia_brevis.AAC.1